MKPFKQTFFALAACLIGFCNSASAQANYKMAPSKDGNMKLSGTSTFHNWTMDTQTFTGSAEFAFKPGAGNVFSGVKALTFNLIVENLKSKDKELDKNAYKALKADEYKNIEYSLTSAEIAKENANEYMLRTEGRLTIAGVTKDISMIVYCIINSDGTVTCKGSQKLRMSDYQIKPPTFMGVMKTGNEIALDFTMIYKK